MTNSGYHLPIHRHDLDNGLSVVVVPIHKAPVVCVNVGYKVGSKDELPSKKGFAHLFEHLMFDGSTNVNRGEFFQYCAAAGGACNAYTSYDQTMYHETMPSHQLEMALWLESDRMMRFGVEPIGLETQQRVITEEINQIVSNQPYGRWRVAQAELAFAPECSYSWEVHGSKDHVNAATMDDVQEFFSMFYRPDNACLVLAGDVTAEHGFELAQRYFGDIPRGNRPIRRNTFEPHYRRSELQTSFEDAVPLAATFISYHCDGFIVNDSPVGHLTSDILSSGRSSRLYRKLVYEQQIASSVFCYFDNREASSLVTFSATAADPSVTPKMLADALDAVIQEITAEEVQEHEIKKSQNALATSMAHSYQNVEGIADTVASNTLFWNTPERANTIVDRYFALSAEDVAGFTQATFKPENRIQVDVVPAL